MRKRLFFVVLLLAACSDTVAPEPEQDPVDHIESWRVTEWLDDGASRVWVCDAVRIHESGTLVCHFTSGGFVLLRSGTFEVRPSNRESTTV